MSSYDAVALLTHDATARERDVLAHAGNVARECRRGSGHERATGWCVCSVRANWETQKRIVQCLFEPPEFRDGRKQVYGDNLPDFSPRSVNRMSDAPQVSQRADLFMNAAALGAAYGGRQLTYKLRRRAGAIGSRVALC